MEVKEEKKKLGVKKASKSPRQKSARLHPQWVIGFTDGAGCFSVSIVKNRSTKLGFQVFPEFVITESSNNLSLLKKIRGFFRCGRVYQTPRRLKQNEYLCKYCVRSYKELVTKILPFFKSNPLRTEKDKNFKTFVRVIELISRKEHLYDKGLQKISKLAQKMNRLKPRQ